MRHIRLYLLALAVALLAAGALLTASAASADPTGTETCHGVVGNGDPLFSFGTWQVDAAWFCNNGQTFSAEIQHTTNGGATWADWGREHTKTSGACNNLCSETLTWAGTCALTGSYRDVVYWNGGVSRTSWKGAGNVCLN